MEFEFNKEKGEFDVIKDGEIIDETVSVAKYIKDKLREENLKIDL